MKIIFLILVGFSLLFSTDTFMDKSTGLQWQDNSATKIIKMNWKNAKEYCKNLTLDGKNDWRLPNQKEFQSIVDITKYNPAIINRIKNVASSRYWSSSPVVSSSSYAWDVDFYSGYTNHDLKSNTFYVRCVRGR